MPASVVLTGLFCLRCSLNCSSNRDLFLTVTLVVRRKCCTLHMHALTAVILNAFNKRREERKHTRSILHVSRNRSDQSSQPTLALLVSSLRVSCAVSPASTTHHKSIGCLLTPDTIA